MIPLEQPPTFHAGSRPAAVAAVLHVRDGVLRLPLVLRRADLPHHPGQVALPGGSLQPGETAWEGAAREVEEELGVPRKQLQAIGAGQLIHAYVSDFSVLPVAAWLPSPPERFRPDEHELDAVFDVPLLRLLDRDGWTPMPDSRLGLCFRWEGMLIWGLTARILLDDLLPRFSRALK